MSVIVADSRGRMCVSVYLGRIDYYMVYDAFLRSQAEKKDLFSLFFRRILLQLCYTFCQWRTADADILYEEREDPDSRINCHTDDSNNNV